MKKIITLFILFCLTLVFAKAQSNMGFEETVKYIKEKLHADKRCREYDFTKDGAIKFIGCESDNYTIYFYDLKDTGGKETFIRKSSDGIQLWDDKRIVLWKNGTTAFNLIFDSDQDAERVYNALLHLRSLCPKKDTFDN